jgi:fluoride exporter
MMSLLLVALGGALGAVARWKLGGLVLQHTIDGRFPASTFLVNLLGCLVAGLLAGLATKLDMLSHEARLFLFTGLLGGFTTFSAFGIETVALLRRGEMGIASAYVIASVAAGVGGVWLGMLLPGRDPV